jgi:hypothetical protein
MTSYGPTPRETVEETLARIEEICERHPHPDIIPPLRSHDRPARMSPITAQRLQRLLGRIDEALADAQTDRTRSYVVGESYEAGVIRGMLINLTGRVAACRDELALVLDHASCPIGCAVIHGERS